MARVFMCFRPHRGIGAFRVSELVAISPRIPCLYRISGAVTVDFPIDRTPSATSVGIRWIFTESRIWRCARLYQTTPGLESVASGVFPGAPTPRPRTRPPSARARQIPEATPKNGRGHVRFSPPLPLFRLYPLLCLRSLPSLVYVELLSPPISYLFYLCLVVGGHSNLIGANAPTGYPPSIPIAGVTMGLRNSYMVARPQDYRVGSNPTGLPNPIV